MGKVLRILLIDDDPDDKFLFEEALKGVSQPADYRYCSSGQAALVWLKETEYLPHYIFLDVNMPKMNGKEVLIEIKKESRLKSLPVIVYSTSNSEQDKLECHLLGAALYVTKPYKLNDLTRVLIHVFETIKPGF